MRAEPNNDDLNEQAGPATQPKWRVDKVVFFAAITFSTLLTVGATFSGLYYRAWQYFVIAASFGISSLFGFLTIFHAFKPIRPSQRFIYVVLTEIAFVVAAVVLSPQLSLAIAVIAISFALIVASTALQGGFIENAIFAGLLAAIGAALGGNLSLVQQVTTPILLMLSGIIAILLVFAFFVLLILGQVNASLRVKLLLGGLMLTLLPLIVISVISNQFTQNQIQTQSNQSLRVAADQTAGALDNFFSTNLNAVETQTKLPAIQKYLALPIDRRTGTVEENELGVTFTSLQSGQEIYKPSYALLGPDGMDLYDSDHSSTDLTEAQTTYFQQAQATGLPYASGITFPGGSRDASLYFIAPIRNVTNQIVGYLRTRYDALVLQSIIQQNTGLVGQRSYPILVDENGLRLADDYSPSLIYHTMVPLSLETYQSLIGSERIPSTLTRESLYVQQANLSDVLDRSAVGQFLTVNLTGQDGAHPHTATAVNLQNQPWKLIYLQEQTNLIEARDAQNRISTILAAIIAAVAGIALLFVSNIFSRPILQLTETAQRISAGDLNSEAEVTSNDEIGILADAFNSMTRQLRLMVETLETRVRERTEQLAVQNNALSYRSTQLQTVADVARDIVSISDLETFLTNVTNLINERFGFYHVGIFLLDSQGEYAVLRAANSAGGRRMLARRHQLKVGETGIVGFVTQKGEPRIATDVGQDAVFFNNPDLPDTRSEMALPLKAEGEVIGALDVQSTESNAFTSEDVDLFLTLADQIAVAIRNNQLFEETRSALAEAQSVHRQYLNQQWTRRTAESRNTSYKYTKDGLEAIHEELPEIETVLETSRPIFKTVPGSDGSSVRKSIMAVPINLRGEAIGVIHLQESRSDDFEWTENELATVQAVSDQVAQTLENARLFEITVRRAERERKALEITSKIRSTNDPQQMLQITLEELKRNLGITDGQIIINLPGGEQQDGNTRPLQPSQA